MSAPDKQMIERVARAIFLRRRNKVRVALGYDPLPDDIAIEERGVNWADAVETAQAALSAITPPNGDEVREALEEAREFVVIHGPSKDIS